MKHHAKGGSRSKIIWVWYRQELLLLLREPVAVFFSLAFPLIIYIFIGIPYAEQIIPDTKVKFIDMMFPTLVGTVAANLLLMGLPIYLAELRSRQVDKRYRALPLSGTNFGIAVISAMLTLTIAASSLIVGIVGFQHGLRSEVTSPLFVLLNIGLVVFLCAVGFFLGTLPLGARTINALTAAVFFVLFFGSGAAAPIDTLPAIIKKILEWNPLKIWFDALVAVYTNSPFPAGGTWKIALTLIFAAFLAAIGLTSWRKTE